MDTDLKQLQIKLKKRKIKPTYIRLKVLSYLEDGPKHPHAEQIFTAIKKDIPTVSMTSIYNTLDLFQKRGLIIPLFITGSEVRFDINVSPHQHFFCERCGKIFDLKGDYDYLKTKNIEGHKVIEIQGYFIGICKNCLENKKRMKGDKNEYV
jgi:Fur family peroxide stress response transcriptional regulator